MNQITLRGRLTNDAEIRITNESTPTTIARFSLAVPDRSHRNANGEYDTDFIKCVAFNSLAHSIESYTGKGSEILITGRLHTYSFKNKEEKNVYMSEVIIEKLEFVSNCKRNDSVDITMADDPNLPFNQKGGKYD